MAERRRPTRAEMRAHMTNSANRERDIADEMAAMYGGCDDPLHPFMPVSDGQPFRDWIDFVDRVARPLVEADGDEKAEQEAMRLYRTVNPYYICVALVMAANRTQSGRDHA